MAGLQVNTDEMKRAAAEAAMQLVQDGMVIGLGSGSTALEFIRVLGQRVAAGLDITAVATSTGETVLRLIAAASSTADR